MDFAFDNSLQLRFIWNIGLDIDLFKKHFFKREKNKFDPDFLPAVSLVIATFNEEVIIRKKIVNTLELDYPKDKLYIFCYRWVYRFYKNDILKKHADIKVLFRPERKGRVAAINYAMELSIHRANNFLRYRIYTLDIRAEECEDKGIFCSVLFPVYEYCFVRRFF